MIKQLRGQTDIFMALGVIGLLGMMTVPLPTPLLDILITANLTLSLTVLLVAMYVRQPLDFSILPSLLLVTTLFRLALNISSTRLILLHAAAGKVIEAFGNFVVGGDLLVGCVIFIILVVIQFVVITSGSGRVAEVAARFTLDEMPGKQMSVDADLNAGLITEDEARHKRREIGREADFYGAMDGASKFIRGDAIASIVIVAVNILGGIAIGAGRLGMPLMDALQRYALLTVGDGLVTQIPALLISTATGIVVTRSASEHDLGRDVLGQLTAHPRAMAIAGTILLALGMVPGMPKISFFILGAGAVFVSWQMRKLDQEPGQAQGGSSSAGAAAGAPPASSAALPQAVDDGLPTVDRLSLDIGYGLIGMLEDHAGPGLLSRITALRKQLSRDLGLLVPPVRVRDDIGLQPTEYVIRLRGNERARGQVRPGLMMAIPSHSDVPPIPGEEAQEPVFDLPARWIQPEQQLQAETRGYTVVEPSAVVATHLSEVVRRHSSDILSRQDVADIIEQVRAEEPAVINDLVPDLASVGQIHQALRQILEEGLSLRDLTGILESLADGLRVSGSLQQAVEYVRMTQAEAICERLCDEERVLHVVSLPPSLERTLDECVVQTPEGSVCALPPDTASALMDEVGRVHKLAGVQGFETVLLTSPRARPHMRSVIGRSYPQVRIISYAELAANIKVQVIGQLNVDPVPNMAIA